MPPGSVAKAEDIYGWQYKEGRDLSGFIDGESHDHHVTLRESHVIPCAGTENPAEEDDRVRVAVNDKCGGSYCITQRWIHKHDVIASGEGEKSLTSLHAHSIRWTLEWLPQTAVSGKNGVLGDPTFITNSTMIVLHSPHPQYLIFFLLPSSPSPSPFSLACRQNTGGLDWSLKSRQH